MEEAECEKRTQKEYSEWRDANGYKREAGRKGERKRNEGGRKNTDEEGKNKWRMVELVGIYVNGDLEGKWEKFRE